jgi:hypothetical protein
MSCGAWRECISKNKGQNSKRKRTKDLRVDGNIFSGAKHACLARLHPAIEDSFQSVNRLMTINQHRKAVRYDSIFFYLLRIASRWHLTRRRGARASKERVGPRVCRRRMSATEACFRSYLRFDFGLPPFLERNDPLVIGIVGHDGVQVDG